MPSCCCVHGCKTNKYDNVRMRIFPSVDSPLFEQWKMATMNPSLLNMDNQKIRKKMKVCNLHFSEKYRLKPVFLKYDFPKLTENIIKVEVLPENKNVDHINRIICNNITFNDDTDINMDHSYCTKVAENNDFQINSHVVQQMSVDEKSAVNDINEQQNQSISTKLHSCFTEAENNDSEIMRNSHEEDVTPKMIVDAKALENVRRRTKLLNRQYYLEKLVKKYKAECKEFSNFKNMNGSVQNFFRSQLRNAGKRSRGENYTLEDKVLALSIYKHSTSCYKFLSRIFTLPSLTTVMNFNKQIKIETGLNV
ncbi:PREDICTED: uncharacterized protein LOC108557287 [Nicrophorus vespilloides]|uniref:Uncharacterized protein LOC108557287 n=1 Tax=Nicrophorus vespilloides TaxID=110193 RepID=A0ABM1M3S5_NICVS|nr:PREDICTED: uncharacterized protein LOC108557287 [Nicrophorus vespilloides]